MQIKKTTAIYSLFIGILNVILWVSLILVDQVPDLDENLINFIFHWASEFTMAGFSLLAGYLILSQHKFSQTVYYFATGMLIIAINGANVHYSIVVFDPVFIIMGSMITAITTILALKNYEDLRDFFNFAMGIIIYMEINFLGRSLQNMDFVALFYDLLALMLSVGLLVLINKTSVYRIVPENIAA